jgi:prepilin-type processing-associated H-X9-DG protein
MTKLSESGDVKPRRRCAFTVLEMLVIFFAVSILIWTLLPALLQSRIRARAIACNNNLKYIVLAVHNYAQANHAKFPFGTVCSSSPKSPGNQYDVWSEAGRTKPGNNGTSFLLAILPFLDQHVIFNAWATGKARSGTLADCWSPAANAGTKDAPGPAVQNIKQFYCPARRSGLRPQDHAIMLSPVWIGGGTDYGGCAGRHAAFSLKTDYNLCDATMHYKPDFRPSPIENEAADTANKRWGIFGRVNVNTTFGEVRDGLSNTILAGELQRIADLKPGSKDGWSVGGPATLFTTGALVGLKEKELTFVESPDSGKPMNNGFFGSPGSEHNNGANFGLADGSVRFFNTSFDPNIFALLGSMADEIAIADF